MEYVPNKEFMGVNASVKKKEKRKMNVRLLHYFLCFPYREFSESPYKTNT